jgi:beta-galactosidase
MTDNDEGGWRQMATASAQNPTGDITVWREQGSSWRIRDVKVERIDAGSASVTATGVLSAVGARFTMTYTIFGSGDVIVEALYHPGETLNPMMPRLGTELIVAPGFENIEWYGRGPAPTYVDRRFERVGVYRSTVDAEWNEFSKPQENSNKVDVRWVALTNQDGIGLLAVGSPLLSVSAYHYTKSQIGRSDYTFRMTRQPQIFLNLDLRQMGVGGVDSWSPNAFPLTPYRIPSDRAYSYRYRLTPIGGNFAKQAKESF